MAKKGTYYGPFFSNFVARIHGTSIRFGILVGTNADGQHDAVFAAPTPPLPCEDAEGGAQPPQVKDVAALLRSKGDLPFTDWAVQHIAAVQKLLPGGLEPRGCFAVAGEAAAKDLAPLLVPVLAGIADPLVLTIDPASRKLSFWQHSSGAKPALRPATMKEDKLKEATLLWAAVPVDIVAPRTPPGAPEEAQAEEIKRGLAEALRACTVGVSAADGEPPRIVSFESEAPVSAAAGKGCSELQCSFLRAGALTAAASNPDGRACVRQRCLVVATAVVLHRATELRHAVGLLREAIVASGAHRLQLALDEAAEEGAERTQGTLQLPFRVLCRPKDLDPGLPLWCGDYCMPDEATGAALERIGQLLGMQESSLEAAPEHLDEFARLRRDHRGTYATPSAPQPTSRGGGRACPLAAAAAAVAALLLALAVPMLQQSS